jgi:hypothetical protein
VNPSDAFLNDDDGIESTEWDRRRPLRQRVIPPFTTRDQAVAIFSRRH